jgi:parallel beta-helix repeat protein
MFQGRFAMKGLALALTLLLASPQDPPARTLRVPADHPGIQGALNAARDGDTVLVERGVYRESLKVAGKSVTLASRFPESKDPKDVEETILDGGASARSDGDEILRVEKSAEVRLVGFTLRGSHHAVTVRGKARVLHNRFHRNGDALSFESGSGTVRSNVFEDNTDDGIDMDGSSEALIEDNVIRNNKDDGIEIRLHGHAGALLTITIRGNDISGNREDGLQLIDYPDRSNRTFRIERNLFSKNAMAAVGCMGDGKTKETYEGAQIPEPILLINNTFVDNPYGLTGGDNVAVVNNVFLRTERTALRRVGGDSLFSHNLFWRNGRDFEDCDLDAEGKVDADPLLGADFVPAAGSPCVDGGTATLEKSGRTLTLAADTYRGRAPDLGAFEAPR